MTDSLMYVTESGPGIGGWILRQLGDRDANAHSKLLTGREKSMASVGEWDLGDGTFTYEGPDGRGYHQCWKGDWWVSTLLEMRNDG
jgi:hypothetical protein